MLTFAFWLVLLLAFIGGLVPPASYPYAPRFTNVLLVVLFVIIGLKIFRTPLV